MFLSIRLYVNPMYSVTKSPRKRSSGYKSCKDEIVNNHLWVLVSRLKAHCVISAFGILGSRKWEISWTVISICFLNIIFLILWLFPTMYFENIYLLPQTPPISYLHLPVYRASSPFMFVSNPSNQFCATQILLHVMLFPGTWSAYQISHP